MADTTRKRELIDRLDQARSRATAHQRELVKDAQIGVKLKSSVNEHRGVWLGAAALIGLFISKIPPRTKRVVISAGGKAKVEKEAKAVGKVGFLLMAFKYIFDLVRPMLITMVTKRLNSAMQGGSLR